MNEEQLYINFDEYIKASEPHKRERAEAWRVAIHRAIFEGVFKHAGKLRTYDITKKEWVLRGDTVMYGRWQDLRMALDYDIEQEKQFDYRGLSMSEVIERLAKFISGIWQTHPFREGNTRTTALFAIKYLKSIGFECNNDMFEQHSWYFRNALVRANYRNIAKDINPDYSFLIKFFRNLLMGDNNELKNRYMLVSPPAEWENETSTGQVQDKLFTDNPNIIRLVQIIGEQGLSVKEMMSGICLKGRDNFMNLYLTPSIDAGYIRLLYPQSPRHPRQKYLLTVKGLALYNKLKMK